MKNILTKKQEKVLRVISDYINKNSCSPTISELCGLLNVRSSRTVTQYLDSLAQKNLIYRDKYVKRGISIIKKQSNDSGVDQIPVINSVDINYNYNGQNVFQNFSSNDFILVSKKIIENKNGNLVAIRANGNCMAEAGIFDGDIFLLEKNEQVKNDDRVLAIIDGLPTIKKITLAENSIIMNSNLENKNPIVMHSDFKILGKVFDVIKKQPEETEEKIPSSQIKVPIKFIS